MTDTRRRNLIILGSAALVSVVLAGLALKQRADQGAPHYAETEFLPGFAANVKNAGLIHVSGPQGAFDVVFSADKGWTLPSRGNYPANFDEVRRTLIGLATLRSIAPRTARADWLHYLNLETPPKGAGVEVTVKNAQGAVLATLIAGKTEDLGDPNGTQGLFVRRPGDNQSWLARAVFAPRGDIASWAMPQVLEVGATRLKDVAIRPASGAAFTVSRANANQAVFMVAPVAHGRVQNPRPVNSIPYAIATFGFVDVRPEKDLDFSVATHAVAHTFDGLTISIDIARLGDEPWARISAAAAPGGAPAIAQQAQAINTRNAGWAYKMSAEKGAALLADLSALTQPPPDMMHPQQQGSVQLGGG